MNKLQLIVAWPMVLLLSGCGIAQRQALMRDNYPYYSENIKRAIDGKYIVEGMNHEQVYLALGPTLCTSTSYYKGRQVEAWAYQPSAFTGRPLGGTFDCAEATQRVYFEDGIVVGWDNM